jgi:hypothetical protein
MRVSLVVETGDVREVHHAALLIGYGAGALNPYLAMESVESMIREGYITDITPKKATKNLIKALGKGVLKIMSKMGISTVSSYSAAQTFEAVGLSQEFVIGWDLDSALPPLLTGSGLGLNGVYAVPAPSALAILALGGLVGRRRR